MTNPPWWHAVLQPFAQLRRAMIKQMSLKIQNMPLDDRLNLDDAASRATRTNCPADMYHAARDIEDAFLVAENYARDEEGRDVIAERYAFRQRRLRPIARRRFETELRGSTTPEPSLKEQTRRGTSMLKDKTVRRLVRHRRGELLLEFTDGTRLFVDATAVGLDLSITSDHATWDQGRS